MTITCSAGNTLIATGGITSNSVTITLSDNNGNTWVNDISKAATGAGRSQVSSAKNINAGSTIITVTFSGSGTGNVIVTEWSGLDATTPNETSSSIDDTNIVTSHVTSADATVIDTSNTGVILSVGFAPAGAQGTLTAGSGYTKITSANGRLMIQYKITSGGVTDDTGPYTSSTARAIAGVISAYKDSSGAGNRRRRVICTGAV